ncbi:PspC domain-containing protein [Actinomyces bowdenii]|uniref:PspC domain-containing protein n=1 Tax=Actinomyces bowdenii TaxID=131109 RepID=UPI001ABC9895|nr:PspC domain-containing protein [Actinomyces bowdenii]MBO3724822.1 PspC domain-containing protein [Actinomyces bowdenii]
MSADDPQHPSPGDGGAEHRDGADRGAAASTPPHQPADHPADHPAEDRPAPDGHHAGQHRPQDRPGPGSQAPPGAEAPGDPRINPFATAPGGAGGPGRGRTPEALSGFFASIRRSGLVRTQERWVGGVAGGVARRLDLDPALVRCVWVVITVISGLGLIVYGLAWALLPEESDGRIHAEQALAGSFDAGLAGAMGSMAIGLPLLDGGLVPTWYVEAWGLPVFGGLLWGLFWIGALILVIVGWTNYSKDRGRRGPAQRPAPLSAQASGGWPAPSPEPAAHHGSAAHPGPGAGMSQAAAGHQPHGATAPPLGAAPSPVPRPTAHPSAAYPGAPGPVRPGHRPGHSPRPPHRPGPGRGTSLAVLGLVLLACAGALLALSSGALGVVESLICLIGAVLIILGGGTIASALRRRRGGWIAGVGVPVLLLAVPALTTGLVLQHRAHWQQDEVIVEGSETVYTWEDLVSGTEQIQELRSGADAIILDLRDMPAEASGAHSLSVELVTGRLQVLTHPGRSLRITSETGAGAVSADLVSQWRATSDSAIPALRLQPSSTEDYTLSGERITRYAAESAGPGREVALTSPAAQAAGPALTIDVEMAAGVLEVTEVPEETTWTGDPAQKAWVVSTWTDADGTRHSGLGVSPVPGMEHPAIGADIAASCLTGTSLEDRDGDEAWEDLDELSAADRERYEACVSRRVQEAGAPSSPGDASSAEPSERPSATAAPTADPGAEPGAGTGQSASAEPSASPTP